MSRVLDVLGALSVLSCAVGILALMYAATIRGQWLELSEGAAAGVALLMLGRGTIALYRLARFVRRRGAA